MRLKTRRIVELMKENEITEDMLPITCGIHCIRDNCFVSPYRARKLSRILGVEVSEIAEEIKS